MLSYIAQTTADDPTQVDVGAWMLDHPLWSALLVLGLVVVVYRCGRWLLERPWRAVLLAVAIGATIAAGGAEMIPFAAITFLVIGVVSAPYRWWLRRRGSAAPRPIPDEPAPPPMRCTAPTIGPCPIHGGH